MGDGALVSRTRIPMFWLAIAYLAVLFWLAWAYNTGRLIEPLKAIPDPIGSMPLAVPWFGSGSIQVRPRESRIRRP